MKEYKEALRHLVESASQVIYDKNKEIELILATWIAGGHVLLEDVPGTGKTILAKTLSRLVNVPMGRVQFTPDLLPADITGSTIYNQDTHTFKFEKGPLFCSFFLADEINRATPRTQSALLESMGENQITADGKTYPMDSIFFVLATQNPIEHHGTFPLPEAQLDRFAIKMSLGYMNPKIEFDLLKTRMKEDPLTKLKPLIGKNEFLALREAAEKVTLHDSVIQYVVDIIARTRKDQELSVGCSPRASLTLLNIARAMALFRGEDFVRPTTIFELIPYVLGHRLLLTKESLFSGVTVTNYLDKLLKTIPAPTK